MRFRVTCTTKLEQHEYVVRLGCHGTDGNHHSFTEPDAIARIESGIDSFYSERPDGRVAEIAVETREGQKFLKTLPDHTRLNNLDWLPDCPARSHKVIMPPPRTVVPAASHGSLSRG